MTHYPGLQQGQTLGVNAFDRSSSYAICSKAAAVLLEDVKPGMRIEELVETAVIISGTGSRDTVLALSQDWEGTEPYILTAIDIS
jgi:hypothetical protein